MFMQVKTAPDLKTIVESIPSTKVQGPSHPELTELASISHRGTEL